MIAFYRHHSFVWDVGRIELFTNEWTWDSESLSNLPKFRKLRTSQKRDWNASLLICKECWCPSKRMRYNWSWRERCEQEHDAPFRKSWPWRRMQQTVEATRWSSSRSLCDLFHFPVSSIRWETVICIVIIVQFTELAQFLEEGLSKGWEMWHMWAWFTHTHFPTSSF